MVAPTPLLDLIAAALEARSGLLDDRREGALRLFNGFYEGDPNLICDVYGRTLLIFNYAESPQQVQATCLAACDYLLAQLPWIRAVVLKTRYGDTPESRHGRLIHGEEPDHKVREFGVWYAIDLLMGQDASLYLDTRLLRQWVGQNLAGRTVLNTFAYTGSLGVAARAGGALRVIYSDLSRKCLNLAKASYILNGFPIHKPDFIAGDFWVQTSRMRRHGERFDCVFLDPPFFSMTSKGRVDQVTSSARLINKVRPLVSRDGYLVAVNNALFVSGAVYLETLEALCAEGYLTIEELIPIPADVTGFTRTIRLPPPIDPAPFNHSTKIVVLRVK